MRIFSLFVSWSNYWATVKGIISPKKQFFMQNTNFASFWSTRARLDLFFKSRNRFSAENCKKFDAIKTHFFHWHFFCFYKQYSHQKIFVVTQLPRRYYTTLQKEQLLKEVTTEKVALNKISLRVAYFLRKSWASQVNNSQVTKQVKNFID